MAHKRLVSSFTSSVLKIVANFWFGSHFVGYFGILLWKIDLIRKSILRYTFFTTGRYLSIKSLLLYGGKLTPPPDASERGKNTVAGLWFK